MSMREEFEAAMFEQFEIDLKPFRKVDGTGFDGYCLDERFTSERSQLATCAWMMWQISRDKLVIDLPKPYSEHRMVSRPERHARSSTLCEVREAIEAAGVKCQ